MDTHKKNKIYKSRTDCKYQKKYLKQDGQALVLYALFFPLLFLFVGVGFDFGWYYLNYSRLQNAAEAAAIAGANTLSQNNDIQNVKEIVLVHNYAGTVPNQPVNLDAANSAAHNYANKNLSTGISESGDTAEDIIKNAWTNETVTLEDSIYKDGGQRYYYVVNLDENISHFLMPGWFEPMPASVFAVAKLTVKNPHVETPNVDEEEQVVLEQVKNENVIVGNWEVQNYYRQNASRRARYKELFGRDFYIEAWNHFQDIKNHHSINGAHYRTEKIVIQDSVGTGLTSNVVSTLASINTINPNSYTYNKGSTVDNEIKGDPYDWKRLDSINVDFKPDVILTDAQYFEDWDLQLGYVDGAKYNSQWIDWTAKKGDLVNRGNLRIHSSINIEQPYQIRSYEDYSAYSDKPDVAYPDILWARIESEPMFHDWKDFTVSALSSVRQIILNFNQSNTAKGADGKYIYRPMIFFYDGPERYDKTNPLRESKPVIVNMNAPFRGALYAPNSYVVVVGDSKEDFQGFIVAKGYKRLKTTADFEAEMEADSSKYTKIVENNKTVAYESTVEEKNDYYVDEKTHTYNTNVYSAEPQTIKWKYTKIIENGIELYIDNYGNVQYEDYPDAPKKYGTYDNFGRTDFTTHGYSVAASSLYNMFVIGN